MPNRTQVLTTYKRITALPRSQPRINLIGSLKRLPQLGKLVKEVFFNPANLAINLVGFLLGRAALFGELYPFGLASLGVSLGFTDKRAGVGLAICTLAGVVASAPWPQSAAYLLTWAILLTVGYSQGGKWEQRSAIVLSILVAGSAFTARVLVSFLPGQPPVDLAFILVEAAGVLVIAYVLNNFVPLIRNLSSHRVLSKEETMGLALIVGAAIGGLHGAGLGVVNFQDLAARWATMIVAWMAGTGAAAGFGVATGMILGLLGGFSMQMAPIYGLAGLLAGVCKGRGRWGVAAGFSLGVLALSYQLADRFEVVEALVATSGAVGLLAVVPRQTISALARIIPGTAEERETQLSYYRRLQDLITGRLKELSGVFAHLGRTFGEVPSGRRRGKSSDFTALLEEVSKRACAGCERKEVCWEEHFHCTYRSFCDLMAVAESGGAAPADVPADLRAACCYVHKLTVAANHVVEVYRVSTGWEKRLAESREIVSGQLRGVADLMQNLAEEARVEVSFRGDLERAVGLALRQAGIVAERLSITEIGGGKLAVEVQKGVCLGTGDCQRAVAPLVSRCLGKPYVLSQSDCGRQAGRAYCTTRYMPERAYELETRVARTAKDGKTVCGDNHTAVELKDGKYAIVLSDGMGSGPKAAMESGATVTMLEQLMKAGFNREFAVRTVNSILLLRSPEESFATVDMVLIDLYNGEAEFMKIGASTSYIKRGREVVGITCGSLPIGILNSVDIEITGRTLRSGDLVVMVTDGIVESKPESNRPGEDWVWQALRKMEADAPTVIAEELISRALANSGGKAADDMTVMVTRILRQGGGQIIPVSTQIADNGR